MVSNNLKTLNYFDKVVYMKDGSIDFFGSAEDFERSDQYLLVKIKSKIFFKFFFNFSNFFS